MRNLSWKNIFFAIFIPVAVAAKDTHAACCRDWDNVENWVYQLSTYQNNSLDQIANSNFQLAVIDLANNSGQYFSNAQIQAVKDQEKIILAYFEIGAMENYRPEWPIPEDLLLGTVGGWPGEYYVKYWDPRWWDLVVKGRIDQALAAGFDGAYLDMIVTYEEIPANSAGTNREDLAQKMVDLIAQLSTYAKGINPQFKVMPQNSPELRARTGYMDAIDGLGIEELYFLAMDDPCNAAWCQTNRNNAQAIRDAGKLVLTIDYANNPANIASTYTQSQTAGFVPYVSVRELNTMRVNADFPPTACDESCDISNQAPVVNAGPNRTITMPNAATLSGTVTDDGLPNPPGAVTVTWSRQSGPGTVTFANANAAGTTATFSAAGSYTLRLTATDGALTSFATMTVSVQTELVNQAPSVSAGGDRSISVNQGAILDAVVADDGLPDPPALVTVEWTDISHPTPGFVTFSNPDNVDSFVTFSHPGEYTLRITASDSLLSSSDSLRVTVTDHSPPSSEDPDMVVYPNPFRPGEGALITLTYSTPNAFLRVYTDRGILVKELRADSAGTVSWNGRNESGRLVASGVYFIQPENKKRLYKFAVQR